MARYREYEVRLEISATVSLPLPGGIDDEDFELSPIENQEEFDIVSEAFDALFLEDDDFLEYEDDDFED